MDIERQAMDIDIACVGFGPATAGFLSTLTQQMMNDDGTPKLESRVMPGMPLQVLCYERADDIGFGVSGVVSKAAAIRASLPDINLTDIPMTTDIKKEKLVYLMDPYGASHRSPGHKIFDGALKLASWLPFHKKKAFESPLIPSAMKKEGGLIFSMGQFTQWIGQQVMGSGMVQLWPGTPVQEVLFEQDKVTGVRLMDQGTDLQGNPGDGFMPGMDINADLTVVGDGPVGAVGQQLDEKFGLPDGNEHKDWAVGMKMVVELPEHSSLESGTVIHTIGYPEPEIFGFLYVHPDNVASMGIFLPSWFDSPLRASYRYLQHWIMHPYFWDDIKGGRMRSWGAKSILESGKRGEPFIVGDGFARIGEGSGSTNIFLNSGVDEAWATGTMLAQAVAELVAEKKPFSKENLEQSYLKIRRESVLEKEANVAKQARDGFQKGFFRGLFGMGLTMLTGGQLNYPAKPKATHERENRFYKFYKARLSKKKLDQIRHQAYSKNEAAGDAILTRLGWPDITYDGTLLMTHQDALFAGGKVQAPGGFRDHVRFVDTNLCKKCENKLCIEVCSGQAITPGDDELPEFDREKCIHCGACMWSCVKGISSNPDRTNVSFKAGTGGLHSMEN